MNPQNDLVQAQNDLIETFNLAQTGPIFNFKELLTAHLVNLLLNQTEYLWQQLYRMDVDERKVKALFDMNNPKEIAPALADLIIERQMQKIATKKKYSGGNNKL
jgi:hypothetical protein